MYMAIVLLVCITKVQRHYHEIIRITELTNQFKKYTEQLAELNAKIGTQQQELNLITER